MSLKLNSLSSTKLMGIVTKAIIIIATGVFTARFSSMAVAQAVEDSASVYKFVEAYQHTINTRDPMALAAFFTDDADLMMFNLPEVHGRQAIENWWRDVWQSKFNRQEPERKGTIVLSSVRFIADDVALANIETKTGGLDSLGIELPTRKARGTWLLYRRNDTWLISAMRGMPTEKDSVVLGASIKTAESLRPHIRAFVDAFEDAWNSHNPSSVSAFFRNDADIIVRNSPIIQGAQAIQDWWVNYFSSPRPYRAILIIDEIRPLGDNVVQLNVIGTGAVPGTENKPRPLRKTRAMWVLVHETGEWHIAALRVLPSEEDRVIRRGGN